MEEDGLSGCHGPEMGEVPDDLIDYLVASEYATLKYLEDKVPAPRVYAYGLALDPRNKVGLSYIYGSFT
jgi:hypothetical protein